MKALERVKRPLAVPSSPDETDDRLTAVLRAPRGNDDPACTGLLHPRRRHRPNGAGSDHPVIGGAFRVAEPAVAHDDQRPQAGVPQAGIRRLGHGRVVLDADHAFAAQPVREETCVPPRAGTDFQDAVAVGRVEVVQHGKHHARLRTGAAGGGTQSIAQVLSVIPLRGQRDIGVHRLPPRVGVLSTIHQGILACAVRNSGPDAVRHEPLTRYRLERRHPVTCQRARSDEHGSEPRRARFLCAHCHVSTSSRGRSRRTYCRRWSPDRRHRDRARWNRRPAGSRPAPTRCLRRVFRSLGSPL